MIRVSWNADGLLQVEMSAEIAQVLCDDLRGNHWSPDMEMMLQLVEDRLLKPHRKDEHAAGEMDNTSREG